MAKTNQHIEIVRSGIAGLSSMSHVSAMAIAYVLSKHYATVGVSVVNEVSDLERLAITRPDLVFLGMKYVPKNSQDDWRQGARVWLADYLDEHDIAYTGSGHRAHNLEINKHLAKRSVAEAGLATAAFRVNSWREPIMAEDLKLAFPVFIKPTNRGGGLGIAVDSLVHNASQLRAKVQSIAARFQADALIEEYLPGREFSVAILKNEDDRDFLVMPIELIAPSIDGARLLSGEVKSLNLEQAVGVTDEAIKLQVEALAIEVFQVLGARDYGRIDIRLDSQGVPNFLEANLIPSLISGYGSFPKSCEINAGLDYESMILRIARLGLARSRLLRDSVIAPNLALAGAERLLKAAC